MSKKKIKGKSITKAFPHFEQVCVIYNDESFYINFDDITKMMKHFDFNLEKKRTRTWGSPIFKK